MVHFPVVREILPLHKICWQQREVHAIGNYAFAYPPTSLLLSRGKEGKGTGAYDER